MVAKGKIAREGRERGERLKGTNFQLQRNVTGMKCTVWGIQLTKNIFGDVITSLNMVIFLKYIERDCCVTGTVMRR